MLADALFVGMIMQSFLGRKVFTHGASVFFSTKKWPPKSHGKYRTFKTEEGFEKETALQKMIGKIVEPHIGKIK